MVKAKITKLEDYDEPYFYIKLSSDEPTKPIAGHRFVDLLGRTSYPQSDVELLLDLYGLKYVPKNVYMELGQALEEPVLHYRFPNKELLRFNYDDYKDHKSGAFDLDEEDIGGLPDGIDIEDNKLIEVKCTTSKFKGFKEEWILQAQFYAYWWNKNKGKDVPIDKIEILKYYVPKENIQAHLLYPNYIVGKYVQHQEFPLDTEEIEKLIQKARDKKKELWDSSAFILDKDGDKDVFFQFKKAMNKHNLTLEYNKDDEDTKRFVSKIYRTRVGKRKKKKKKGLKKI